MKNALRNIAIIAHVDHGKTTLVDALLKQSGTFRENETVNERVMDSNDLERERGITILAKNCAINYKGVHINIVDTPGHADFGGEVERSLSMVDSVLLLVDAVEGPMPQTRFVTQKALSLGLKPIVVVNKIDRPAARIDEVINETFDLFDRLGATDEQLDFPIVYTSAINGYATNDPAVKTEDMTALYEAMIKYAPQSRQETDGPFRMQISSLDYSPYTGLIGIGRIARGKVSPNMNVVVMNGPDSTPRRAKINQILTFEGLERRVAESAGAGDIVLINGIDNLLIGSTVCAEEAQEAFEMLTVDEPSFTMNFMVNTSPFAGREGEFVTSRHLRERLERETKSNVALRVNPTDDETVFEVSGRGVLHLCVLIENMRREGYELAVSRPKPVIKEIDGVDCSPVESLTVDVEDTHQGAVMEELSRRGAQLVSMASDGRGRTRLDWRIAAGSLIGFQSEFVTMTHGLGVMSHVFDAFEPVTQDLSSRANRQNGVLISMQSGTAVAYALWKLQDRGRMFVTHNDPIYEGQIIGIHSRENDIAVNPIKGKQLTNIRASGTDEAIRLVPAVPLTLEYAVEFINDDELVEITPKSIRLRKRLLTDIDRRRAMRTTS